MDYEGQWQKVGTSKAVAVASMVYQETFRSIRAFGDIDILKLRFFFKGTKQALARSTPSSMALNTVGTEKSSSLTPGAVARGLEGNDDIDCRANDVSIKVDSVPVRGLFLFQKKSSKSAQRKRKENRKEERK